MHSTLPLLILFIFSHHMVAGIRIPVPDIPNPPTPNFQHFPNSPDRLRFPKIPDSPNSPSVPKVPDSPDPPSIPKFPDSPNNGPNSPTWNYQSPYQPSQEQIKANMGKLERKLIDFGIEAMAQVVDGILGELSETTGTDNTFTPTTTLPSTSFAACTSYAKHLLSCASATTSFYSLDATKQASCACYSTPSSSSCYTSTPTAAIVPTLEASNFDYNANRCYEFFEFQGYENGANAMNGTRGNRTVLGAGFCGRIANDTRNGNVTGLKQTLAPLPTKNCYVPFTGGESKGDAMRGGGLTIFDHGVFVSASIVIAIISYAAFL